MSKQDRQGVRTSAGLEQKYRFGRYFSEQEKENDRQNKELDQQNMTLREFVSIASSAIDELQKGLTAANQSIQELTAKNKALEDKDKALEETNSSLSSQIEKYWEIVYPVGSFYLTLSDQRPENLFGGEWLRIEDRFLLASGSIYGAGTTGGEATHTLTVNEMPSHEHKMNTKMGSYDAGGGIFARGNGWATSFTSNDGSAYPPIAFNATGGSQPHNNMPPYLAVRVWQRTK